MATPYTYTELKAGETRILHLHRELDTGILQCNLENIFLKDSKRSFAALSWTWGKAPKPEECVNINLNGKEFSIRPNLHEALSALCKDNETIHIWIDAICINQMNPEEKNHQIPLMADIYTSASEVYVWLGGSANDSDYIMESLRSNKEENYHSRRFTLGLFEMLLRPWWTRTWIVQEYVLNKTAPKVFCGPGAGVSGELLLSVWRRRLNMQELYHRRADLQKISSRYWLYSLRDSRHNSQDEYLERNLRNALSWLRNFEATKPQDKIYGALGLIEAKWREQFVMNFGVHTDRPAEDVYHDAAIYLLMCEKSSTYFYDFAIGRQSHSVLPSWVPNFNLEINLSIHSVVRLGDVTSAHLDIPRDDVKVSEDRLELSTQGLIVDQVDKLIVVEDRPFSSVDINEIVKSLRLLHQIRTLVDGLPSYQSCEVRSEPLWKTLIAGCYGSIKDEDLKDEPGCEICFEEWMTIPLDTFQNHFMAIFTKFSAKPRIIHKIGHTLSPGRLFFSGQQGSYGISEAGAQEGDVVALLFPNHFVPFILREVGDRFEMVGVAYIPQPFKEAVIKNFKDDRRTLQDFVIT